MKIALQMYSVRDGISDQETLFNALEKVRDLGYEGVEFAGCFGADPAALKAKLQELGLTAVGCHETVNITPEKMDEMVAFYQKAGVQTIACAYAPTGTAQEVEDLCGRLSMLKEKAEKAGMNVAYHNHAHEFKPINGELPIDRIAACCPMELDSYWSFIAGEKNGEYIRNHKDKIGLLHLKDGSADGHPCAIGEGVVNIQEVLDAAKDIGLEWIIVENDNPVPDGLSDVGRSIQNLRTKYSV